MNAIDTLFFIFFLSFIPISWFIDAAALGLSFWPPNTTKRLVAWWVRLCDPLLGTPPLWFRAMTWFEVGLCFGTIVWCISDGHVCI
jgi:CCR4-NOT transcriptional regulation complex NOT5 subunit